MPDSANNTNTDGATVSAIVAAYNAEHTLTATIDSLVAQRGLERLEIIVVDDASSDSTLALAQTLAARDARIKVLQRDRNGGAGAARNLGLKAATGKWIAPVDADDQITPNRLTGLVQAAEAAGADFAADSITSDSLGVASDNCQARVLPDADLLPLERLIESDMPRNGQVSYGFLKPLMRKDFLDRHGLEYDSSLRCAEDFKLYAAGLLRGAKFILLPWSGYVYNHRAGSQSRCPSNSIANLQDSIRASRSLRNSCAALTDQPHIAALLRRHEEHQRAAMWLSGINIILRRYHTGNRNGIPRLGRPPRLYALFTLLGRRLGVKLGLVADSRAAQSAPL